MKNIFYPIVVSLSFLTFIPNTHAQVCELHASGLKVGITATTLNENWQSVEYKTKDFMGPVAIAQMQTYHGADTAAVRSTVASNVSVDFKIEEETSFDNEIAHPGLESIGYVLVEESGRYPSYLRDINHDIVGSTRGKVIRSDYRGQWFRLQTPNQFDDSITIPFIGSYNESDPAHLRLRTTTGGFAPRIEVMIEEWSHQDGVHAQENLEVLTVQSGIHQMQNGQIIMAGKVGVSQPVKDQFTYIEFPQAFPGTPVVLSHAQTYNGSDPMVTRMRNVTAEGFEVLIEEEEAKDNIHTTETIGYIAIWGSSDVLTGFEQPPIYCGDPKTLLGKLDLTANNGINPSSGEHWQVGDQYRLAFITQTTTDASNRDISYYNQFVQQAAANAGLGGVQWFALGSTDVVDARDNTTTNPEVNGKGYPIFSMNGSTLIANNNFDLWDGSVDANITLNQHEVTQTGRVFTGSIGTGLAPNSGRVLGGSNQSTPRVVTGDNRQDGSRWITYGSSTTTSNFALYAISEPLTVSSDHFDTDGDGVLDINDAFPLDTYESQDADGNGLGDHRGDRESVRQLLSDPQADYDNDGVANGIDNCPEVANSEQANSDVDAVGDRCDSTMDRDGDNHQDWVDFCPDLSGHNGNQQDADHPLGDVCQASIVESNAQTMCFLSPVESGPGTEGMCPSEESVIPGMSTRSQGLISRDGEAQLSYYRGQLNILTTKHGRTVVTPVSPPQTAAARFYGAKARFLENDELALFDKNGNKYWGTNTTNKNASYWILRNDGVLYLECANGDKVWKSHGDELLATECGQQETDQQYVELAEKLRIVSETLCSTEEDRKQYCPTGVRFQFISEDDSYIDVEPKLHLYNWRSQASIAADILWTAFKAKDVVVTKCLSSDNFNETNDCTQSEQASDFVIDSLFLSPPEGMTFDNEPSESIANWDIKVGTLNDKKYIVNQCYRHISNDFFFDSLEYFQFFSASKEALVERYYPKFDCLYNSKKVEQSMVEPFADYPNALVGLESAAFQVIKFGEEAAVIAVAGILTGGAADYFLAGSEFAVLIEMAGTVADTVGYVQGIAATLNDLSTAASCKTNACRTHALIDGALNAAMLYGQLKSETQLKDPEAASLIMPKFSETTFGAGSLVSEAQVSMKFRQDIRLLTLLTYSDDLLLLSKTLNSNSTKWLFDALRATPEAAFNDAEFMGALLERFKLVAESQSEAELNSLTNKINEYNAKARDNYEPAQCKLP